MTEEEKKVLADVFIRLITRFLGEESTKERKLSSTNTVGASLKLDETSWTGVELLPEVLTAKDIGEHLHVTVQQVYNLFRLSPAKGGIPSFAIGIKTGDES